MFKYSSKANVAHLDIEGKRSHFLRAFRAIALKKKK
jgi:hypothetical protein